MQPSRADSRAYVARGARQNGAMGLNTCLKSDPTNNLSRRAHADTSMIFIQIGPTPLATEISLVFVASFPSSLSCELLSSEYLSHTHADTALVSHTRSCVSLHRWNLAAGWACDRARRAREADYDSMSASRWSTSPPLRAKRSMLLMRRFRLMWYAEQAAHK
jgi:hypothetical protein